MAFLVSKLQLMLVMSVGIFFFNHGLNNWLPELLRHSGMSAAEAGIWAALPTAVGVAGALLIPRLATPRRRLAILAGRFAAFRRDIKDLYPETHEKGTESAGQRKKAAGARQGDRKTKAQGDRKSKGQGGRAKRDGGGRGRRGSSRGRS